MTILLLVIAICSIVVVGEMASLVSFQSKNSNTPAEINVNVGAGVAPTTSATDGAEDGEAVDNVPDTVQAFSSGENTCAGANPNVPNVQCVLDAITNPAVGPQAGANVTKGYRGEMEVEHDPITTPYWMNGMCPVNVHWHLGAEHLSVGEYDENGTGPGEQVFVDGGVDPGFRCNKYDAEDPKFTKAYEWKHCINMMVGETYEVHWPHSAAGACGTPNQYQTPFYDGVFCNAEVLDLTADENGVFTATHKQIGVQSQVFTIVNDEMYYYPDLFRGMIVDGDMGMDIAMYTGSTTGSKRSNEVCSKYSPITWQVDRKCHLISASSFDKMCADMKAQRDDMTLDLFPHGSRAVVDSAFVADNQANRKM